MNIYIKYPDSIISNISNNNISYEKLPSNQRNNAYGNSHNRINNFKKEKEKNYYAHIKTKIEKTELPSK